MALSNTEAGNRLAVKEWLSEKRTPPTQSGGQFARLVTGFGFVGRAEIFHSLSL
jgi:hypothetical protein